MVLHLPAVEGQGEGEKHQFTDSLTVFENDGDRPRHSMFPQHQPVIDAPRLVKIERGQFGERG
jgi:hypothetical protein